MTAKRTDKYIIKDLIEPKVEAPWSPQVNGMKNRKGERILYLDGNIVPGAFYLESVWFKPFKEGEKPDLSSEDQKKMESSVNTHKHDHDEVLCFFGTNPDDIRDLCGKVEFWVDGEKHFITKSVMIYVSAGVEHGPLKIHRVDRPIFHFTSIPQSKVYY